MYSQTSFYSQEELSQIGLKSYGNNVLISRYARIYSPHKISIGDNVRIDDFCILSGEVTLGSHIHISPYVALYGAMGIVFEDYSGISARGTIYSAMDDFSGDYMIGPILPDDVTNVTGGAVIIKKYVQIGAHSILFPDLTVGEGSVVGACSLVRTSLEPWGIYAGVPCKFIKARKKNLLELAKKL